MADENTNGQQPNADDSAPPPLTEEDIGRIANSAVTSHLKRALPGAIKEGLAALNIGETIATQVAKLAPAPPVEGDKPDDKKAGNPKLEAQLKELAEKLEKSEHARAEEARQRVEVEQARLRDSAVTSFRSAVSQKVRPELLDVFVDHYGNKNLQLSEDGKPVLMIPQPEFKGGPEVPTAMPLDDKSIQLLLARKDVAPFLPAPGGQQGGGDSPRTFAGVKFASVPDGDAAKAQHAIDVLKNMGVDTNDLF